MQFACHKEYEGE